MAPKTETAVVEEIRSLTRQVRELVLQPTRPFSYKAGQWIALHLPVGPNPPKIRAYSLATPPQGGRITLSLNLGGGEDSASRYLFGLKQGDTVAFSGPNGKFTLPTDRDRDFLFVARFTGIVPIRCMILDLFSRPFSRDVVLIYGAPDPEERIYGDAFEALARQHPNFRYFPLLSGRTREGAEEAATLQEVVSSPGERLAYVCGLRALVTPVEEMLRRIGFSDEQIRKERYD